MSRVPSDKEAALSKTARAEANAAALKETTPAPTTESRKKRKQQQRAAEQATRAGGSSHEPATSARASSSTHASGVEAEEENESARNTDTDAPEDEESALHVDDGAQEDENTSASPGADGAQPQDGDAPPAPDAPGPAKKGARASTAKASPLQVMLQMQQQMQLAMQQQEERHQQQARENAAIIQSLLKERAPTPTVVPPPMANVWPKEKLTQITAADPQILDRWTADVRKGIVGSNVKLEKRDVWLRYASPHWAKELDDWLEQSVQLSTLQGGRAVPESFDEFVVEMRKHFVSGSDGLSALLEFGKARQASGESMETFFTRVQTLIARIGRMSATPYIHEPLVAATYAQMILGKLNAEEWPQTVSRVQEWILEQVSDNAKRATMSIARMRDRCAREAVSEPKRAANSESSPANSHEPRDSAVEKRRDYKRGRVEKACLDTEAGSGSEESDSDESDSDSEEAEEKHLQLSAMGRESRPDDKCNKCGKFGHRSFECKDTTTELRQCFACGKTGHIRPNCRKSRPSKNA